MPRTTRVLGIDCGSNATGFGVIDSDGRSSVLVTQGVIRTRPNEAFALRLRHINGELRALIATHAPHAVAVEGIFHSVNARSALQLGHVRGVALLAAADANIPVHEYSPLQVKNSVVGYGRAEKSQVQQMVKLLLRLAEIPAEDAADAIAVALCHSHHALTITRLSRAAAGERSRPAAVSV